MKLKSNLTKSNQHGASLVEYALLIVLISLVCITALTELGTTIRCKYALAGAAIRNDSNFIARLEQYGTQYLCSNPSEDWGG